MPRVCKTLGKLENLMVLGVCIGGGRERYIILQKSERNESRKDSAEELL